MSVKRRGLGRGLDALLKPEEPGVRALPLSETELTKVLFANAARLLGL